jgi:hypothetical protein
MKKAMEVSPAWGWALGMVYARTGRTEEAQKILDELNKLKTGPFRAFSKAVLNTALGHNDEAFRWLNFEPHHVWIGGIRCLDWFAPLRKDPRFPDELRRMNLPPL